MGPSTLIDFFRLTQTNDISYYMEKYSSFYSWDRNYMDIVSCIFIKWSRFYIQYCKVNHILQKTPMDTMYKFWKKFRICLDRYMTQFSYRPSYPVHNKAPKTVHSKLHDRSNNARNAKKGDFQWSGNFSGNGETTMVANYEYLCPYWLFSNQSSLIHVKFPYLMVKTQHSAILAHFHMHYNH